MILVERYAQLGGACLNVGCIPCKAPLRKAFHNAMWESTERTGSWQGEILDRRKNGELYAEWLTIAAVKADDGRVTHYVGAQKMTSRNARLRKMKSSTLRSATPSPNSPIDASGTTDCSKSWQPARAVRYSALLFIDPHHYRVLNDSQGHDKGDSLLQQVAQRISTCTGEGDTVAPLGGDEFVVILKDLSDSAADGATQARNNR